MLLFDKLERLGLRLVLASQSPRRRQLMEGSHLPCDVVCYNVDESYPAELLPEEVPEYLAKLKGSHYPVELTEHEILITADTIVICDGRILGKPRDRDDAHAMLGEISGRQHKVITGVALRSMNKSVSFSVQSAVHFAPLTSEEIEFYIEQYSPLDKAGSYGIQEWIGYIGIERIEGSFYNVMGLPIQRLYTELKNFIE
ncbi:MAG: Maf family nucleotide pyrophosphatase [Rikenellaceae bacterium]